jgi:O-antigen/teichoic acid export membrane protein
MLNTSSPEHASKAVIRTSSERNILAAAKGSSIILASRIFGYGCRFLIGILLGRFLGAEQLGLYNLVLTAATIASGIALLGLRSAMVRFVSRALSQQDDAGVWGTLQIGLGITTVLGLILGGGLYLLAVPIAEHLFHEPSLAPLLRYAIVIVPSMALIDIVSAATRGFKRMEYTAIARDMVQPLIKVVLFGILAIVGLTAARALTVFSLTVVVVAILLLYFLSKLFPLNRPLGKAQYHVKEILLFSLPLYLSDLIQTFRRSIETVLLGTMSTIASVGVFTVASQVNIVGQMFHQSIVTVSMPIVSELHTQGEQTQMAGYYQTMTKWTFMVNLPVFLILFLFPAQILGIFGESFVGGATALSILAWGNLVNTGTGICGVVLDMSGKTALKLVNSIVTVVLTLLLSALMIPRWGVIGAAISRLTSVSLVNLLRLVEVYVLFRLLPYNRGFWKPIAAGVIMLAAGWGMRQVIHLESHLLGLIVNVIVLGALYVGTIFLLGLAPEEKQVLRRLVERMRSAISRW